MTRQADDMAVEKTRRIPSSRGQVTGLTQVDRSRETQHKVLQAALSVLVDAGYVGFRTEAVVVRAGVSRGAMLHHYPKKRDLIIATYEYLFADLVSTSLERVVKSSDYDTTLDAMLGDAEEFFMGKYFLQIIDLLVSAVKEPQIRADILEISRRNRDPVERAWTESFAQFVPYEIAEDIVFMSFNLFRGFATRTIIRNEPERFDRIVLLWKDMVRAHLEKHRFLRAGAADQ